MAGGVVEDEVGAWVPVGAEVDVLEHVLCVVVIGELVSGEGTLGWTEIGECNVGGPSVGDGWVRRGMVEVVAFEGDSKGIGVGIGERIPDEARVDALRGRIEGGGLGFQGEVRVWEEGRVVLRKHGAHITEEGLVVMEGRLGGRTGGLVAELVESSKVMGGGNGVVL